MLGIIYHCNDIPVQGPAVESGRKEFSLIAPEAELPEDRHVGIGEVHLTLHLLFLRLCVTAQPGPPYGRIRDICCHGIGR